jgi:hypothetical protein
MSDEWDNRNDSAWMNGARLYFHLLIKGIQLGGVVGTTLVTPAILFRRRAALRGPGAAAAVLSAIGVTSIATTATAFSMGAFKLAGIPAEELAAGLQDRAYRLHYNQGQNRVDTLSQVGMAAGALSAASFVGSAATVVLGGATMGAAAGVLVHAATMTKSAKAEA